MSDRLWRQKRYTDEVTGPTPEECDVQVGVIEAAIKLSQEQFDASNATQPAPLPGPGGITKIGPDGKETPQAAGDEEPAVTS